MEIESPTVSPTKGFPSEQSLHDACYQPKSRYLTSQNRIEDTIISYEFSFREVKSGMLDKKTLNSNWQSRFFLLTPLRLLYYADSQKSLLKGCFNLASLIDHRLEFQTLFPEISLQVRTGVGGKAEFKTLLTLQILDQSDYNAWLRALKETVLEIRRNLLHLSIFPRLALIRLTETNQKFGNSHANFWNRLEISSKELLAYGSHLDILFLRSKSTISCLHRFFMRSHFDHVGLLLKDEHEKPYLLEVVSQKGVIISPLENLLATSYQEYEEIGYRKLLSQPNQLPLQKLEQYVNSLIGKKYELSLTKLLLDNETEADEEEQVVESLSIKSERTYFCSELIADIYLKFGVLLSGKSNSFWPKDFEEEVLPLCEGYSLSPIMFVEIPQDSDHSAIEE